MSQLLLTSSGRYILNNELPFLSKPLKKMRLAYINTASQVQADKSYSLEKQQKFLEGGYDFEIMDIAKKNAAQIRDFLKNKDAVYVEGGNTFYLLKCVRESGFDIVVKELIAKGLLYIGSSAGSYICCPTIETAGWKPHPDLNSIYVEDLTAMNLVPFLMVAHYEVQFQNLIQKHIQSCAFDVKILTDNQALWIKDGVATLLGQP